MDPDEAWRTIVRTAGNVQHQASEGDSFDDADVEEMANQILNLNQWFLKKGFPPSGCEI